MAFHISFQDTISATTQFFAFRGKNILLKESGENISSSDFFALCDLRVLDGVFYEDGYDYVAAVLKADATVPRGFSEINLREYFAQSGANAIRRASRAKAIAHWRHTTRFCAFCGERLSDDAALSALYCPKCQMQIFPRIEPATITLVTRGDEILLARHVKRISDLWACISGFIEAGETAEQCVEREIAEEVGIRTKNIRYLGRSRIN